MKYELTNGAGEKKIFNYIKEMTDILNEFEITAISDNDICLLQSGMEIEKKDNYNRLVWTIKKVA
jgi:hypothetical protein